MKQHPYLHYLPLLTLLCIAQLAFAQQKVCALPASPITYIYQDNGAVDAFPQSYIAHIRFSADALIVTDTRGTEHSYIADMTSISDDAPDDMPYFTGFWIDNKHNDMLMVDAVGTIIGDSAIVLSVGGIGKRIVPSFQISETDAAVYVNGEVQLSGKTSHRFEDPIVYTVARPGSQILREMSDGTFAMMPLGRDYRVSVDYLADHPTTQYGVPIIRITTDDGLSITSRDYYKTARISIDGAGYYPDLAEMAVNVKGRGNSSWNGSDKKPYRLKFPDKQKPLGMKAGKNWNLIASAQTGSMTSNMIGSRIAEMVQADGANHFIPVELYINGQYRGSYSLTEKVGFANNSIDLDDETNAALLELDTYSADFYTTARFSSNSLPVTIHKPDFSDTATVTNLTQADISSSFNAFISALSAGQDVSAYVHFPSLARFLMVNDIIINYELMHPKSTFCYNENILADSLYHFGPAWDFDWGFGYEKNRTYFVSEATVDYYSSAPSHFEVKPFIYQLRYCDEEMNRQYYRVWTDFVNNHLEELCEYCADYYQVANASLTHDNTKWHTGNNYQTITNNSIHWLRQRANWVYDYLSNTLGYADKDYLDTDTSVFLPEAEHSGAQTILPGVYNMLGQRMSDNLSSLPAGVYIVDGEKIVIR